MHDTLDYFAQDPIHRKYHHDRLTFSLWYAFFENFVLPLSHDEVVYGKGSLLGKMPGDDWQQFANLRLLYGYMWTHPGKKLLFMGGEFGQRQEWTHEGEPRLVAVEAARARRYQTLGRRPQRPAIAPSPHCTRSTSSPRASSGSIVTTPTRAYWRILRRSRAGAPLLVVCNFTPVVRTNYMVGVPQAGSWHEVLNGDAQVYGGSGIGNFGGVLAAPVPAHGHAHALSLTLAATRALLLKPADSEEYRR